MKKNILHNKFITAFFALLCLTNLNAQNSIGKDFWVAFLPNIYEDIDSLSIIVSGKNNCSGVITNPQTGWSSSFNVTAGRVTNVYIPPSQGYGYNSSDCIINKGFHITTTDSVLLYISCFEAFSFDITNVLSTPSLGSDYIIQTYTNQSEFTVVATEDNTTININLAENSLNHNANTPFMVTLNSGECYQVLSLMGTDLSGSTISANDNKKIAVFAGNPCNRVPTNYEGRDHMMEQMIPTSYWGQEFVITSTMLKSKDRVRVTALNDNCQIRKDGVLLANINAQQTYEFEVTDNTPAIYLETSEPTSVILYFTGFNYSGQNGDPSMVTINHLDQKLNDATFRTFNAGTSNQHYVNVVTKTNNVDNMRLDGNNISSSFFAISSNSNYSYARIALTHGRHTLTNLNSNENSGFVAHVYGIGPWETYSYSLGSVDKIDIDTLSSLFVNNLDAEDYPEGFHICSIDSNILFDIEINYDVSNVVWHFGDGTTDTGYPITHRYNEFGTYNVSCDIYITENGTSYLYTTLSTILEIDPMYDTTITANICQSEIYSDNGFDENQTGVYVHTFQTTEGCDSIVRLNLTVTPEYNDTIYAHICQGQIYDDYGFYESEPTITTKYLKTISGCDSIVTLNLKIQDPYTDTIYATIGEGGCYNKYGFYECSEGVYTRNLTTNMGCDSIVYLFLEVITEADLYVENCVTPKNPINNRFYIRHSEKLIIDDVHIYNRWGRLIFNSPNNTEAWDGKYNGEYCPQAAYVYIINYHQKGIKTHKVKVGTVMLLY